jgi:hypothetical protein
MGEWYGSSHFELHGVKYTQKLGGSVVTGQLRKMTRRRTL